MCKLQHLLAGTVILAAALLGTACSGSGDPASPSSEPVGRAVQALLDCNDCGNAIYCSADGNLVYLVQDGSGGCTIVQVITCTSGSCQTSGDCVNPDVCL